MASVLKSAKDQLCLNQCIYSGITYNEVISLPNIPEVPFSNSFDPDETPSNAESHLDPSCLTLRQHFYHILPTLKQTGNVNVIGGLGVMYVIFYGGCNS